MSVSLVEVNLPTGNYGAKWKAANVLAWETKKICLKLKKHQLN